MGVPPYPSATPAHTHAIFCLSTSIDLPPAPGSKIDKNTMENEHQVAKYQSELTGCLERWLYTYCLSKVSIQLSNVHDQKPLSQQHGGGHGWPVWVTVQQCLIGKILAGHLQLLPAWLQSCQSQMRQASPFGKWPEEGALLLGEDPPGREGNRQTRILFTFHLPSNLQVEPLWCFSFFVSSCHSLVFEQ